MCEIFPSSYPYPHPYILRPGSWDWLLSCVLPHWYLGGPPDSSRGSFHIRPRLQRPGCSHHQGGSQAGPLLPSTFTCSQPQWDTKGYHSGMSLNMCSFLFIWNDEVDSIEWKSGGISELGEFKWCWGWWTRWNNEVWFISRNMSWEVSKESFDDRPLFQPFILLNADL